MESLLYQFKRILRIFILEILSDYFEENLDLLSEKLNRKDNTITYNISDLKRILKVSKPTIYRLLKSLPHVRLGTSKKSPIRVLPEDLNKFLENHKCNYNEKDPD